jgi:hypothetical protein
MTPSEVDAPAPRTEDLSGVRGIQYEPRESGVAPARARDDSGFELSGESVPPPADEIEFALVEGARTEANLNQLVRGLARLSAGAQAARDSSAMLLQELGAIQQLLSRQSEREAALHGRLRLVEETLELSRRDAERERALFIEQEDAFLVQLLDDHERELDALRRELDRPTVETGVATLDPSELPTLPPPASHESTVPTLPPPSETEPAPSSRATIGAVKLRTIQIASSGSKSEDRGPASAPVPSVPMFPPPAPVGVTSPAVAQPPMSKMSDSVRSIFAIADTAPSMVAASGSALILPPPADVPVPDSLSGHTLNVPNAAVTEEPPASRDALPESASDDAPKSDSPADGVPKSAADDAPKSETSADGTPKSEAPRRPSSRYSLGAGEVADECVDVVKIAPRSH